MTMDEWEPERIRLDTQVAQARTDGVGERAAFRLVLLHNRVKPEETQELEEATETYSKKRKTEDHEEQGQDKDVEEEQEKKDQWYAHYLELKKALDDHLAVKPAGVDVPSATSEPRGEMSRNYHAMGPRECTMWYLGPVKKLSPLRVSMRDPVNVSTYALDDLYKLVRQGYKIETNKPLDLTARDWIHDIFSKLVERRPLEGGVPNEDVSQPDRSSHSSSSF